MNKSLISIVVPVYNVEEYLAECVDSILSQSFRDFEILLIDDGSTDASGLICDKYVKKDERVKVAHIPNGGLAAVRNMGIENAVGDIIAFVDSDDIIALGSLQALYDEMISSGADVVLGKVERFNEKNEYRPYTRLNERREMTGKETLALLLEGRLLNISMCGGIYKRSLFDGITFPIGYICEDWYVTPSLYLKTDKVVFIPQMWYLYRDNSESTMGRLYKSPNPQVIEVAEHAISVIQRSGDEQLFTKTLWSNLRRVWKLIGGLYQRGQYQTENNFVNQVRAQLKRYWSDLSKTGEMNLQEKFGVWSFCYCEVLYHLLRKLK